jgi:hypothetical protein
VTDTVSIPPHEPQTEPQPQTQTGSRLRRNLVPAGLVVVSLALVVCCGTVLMQRSQMHDLRRDLSTSSQSNAATQDGLTADVQTLNGQVQALQGSGGVSSDSVSALEQSVDALSARLKSDEARLKLICVKSDVAAQRSNIYGQETADPNSNYIYYSNLTGIIDSICGSPPFSGE